MIHKSAVASIEDKDLELKENHKGELSHCEKGEKQGEEDQQTPGKRTISN